MAKFKVWLRPSGHDCKIRIEGMEYVSLLRDRLQKKGFICSEPEPVAGGSQCVVHAAYPPQGNVETLQHCVSEVPEIELMLEPA